MEAIGLRIVLAYGLDLLLGDPAWLPHPIRGLGWVIESSEAALRRLIRSELLGGILLVLLIGGGTWGLVGFVVGWAARISPLFALGMEAAFLYICLSTKDLAVESWPVFRALERGDLPLARRKLSMIVGRDTGELDEPEVTRGTVETIGESLMDGVVSPLFYAAIGGVGLACCYKAVNTLDSMVGYRSSRYLRFGKASAAVDRCMNALPAWITAGLIAAAAGLLGLPGGGSLRAFLKNPRARQENSWIPEAAMAGALGVRLGGVNRYQGLAVETPFLGEPLRPLGRAVIPQAIRVMWMASGLSLFAALGLAGLIR
ncbi:MAG: cobalamin biosynthesis protein CobD [Candidatus Omnitrophica bacterium]|nr:cobalamin biosynthesis protein CobD [Candidatus Omnitrophota bacterium]